MGHSKGMALKNALKGKRSLVGHACEQGVLATCYVLPIGGARERLHG